MSFLCSNWCIVLQNLGASSWVKKLFNDINVLARAGHAFSAAAVLPVCETHCANLSAAVDPVLNMTTACQEITSFFNTVTIILSQNFYQKFVPITKNHSCFSRHQRCKHYFIRLCRKLADWLLPYWKLWFQSTNLKIYESEKPLGIFYWKLSLISCSSYDNLYVSITFWDTGYDVV